MRIHRASLAILERTGVQVEEPEKLRLFEDAGADGYATDAASAALPGNNYIHHAARMLENMNSVATDCYVAPVLQG